MNGMIKDSENSHDYGKDELIKTLENYPAIDAEEAFIPRFLHLLKSEKCFYRDHFTPGHITASALLMNKENNIILMNYHKSLNKWLNFGGHCDGEEDVLSVAIRETMEESGLTAFKPVSADIIDIDIHTIPANPKKGEPEHEHFDIRYVMQMTDDQQPIISDESLDLKWMNFEEALSVARQNESLTRLIRKAQALPEPNSNLL